MGSLFARLDAAAERVQQGVYGERWRLVPLRRAGVNSAPAPDPDRAEREVVGIYRDAPTTVSAPDAYDQRTDKRPGVVTGDPIVEIDPRNQAEPPLDVREGDLLVRLADGVTWRIANAPPDGMGRLQCRVLKTA
ncbi:hypothetical protein Ga0061061_111120 [Chelatococcus sambhunathii]|uniref:Head-to-tail stopper n=1 Tax=Chelatococcus sambhunathii TaxID=363953 RepID=A0ABM9UAZ4_9HYPH|nr:MULTISPECIES: hypothetical protein [Chelatococcus]CUA90213.1 hypothetical protein Ga0061061_111120 [Chelatococcus sambhunathii]